MHVLSGCGHLVHEDVPEKVWIRTLFLNLYCMCPCVEPPMVSTDIPGKIFVCGVEPPNDTHG